MSCIASDEHATDTQLRHLTVMDTQVTAPVDLASMPRGARSAKIFCTSSSDGTSPSMTLIDAMTRRRVALIGNMVLAQLRLGIVGVR